MSGGNGINTSVERRWQSSEHRIILKLSREVSSTYFLIIDEATTKNEDITKIGHRLNQ